MMLGVTDVKFETEGYREFTRGNIGNARLSIFAFILLS